MKNRRLSVLIGVLLLVVAGMAAAQWFVPPIVAVNLEQLIAAEYGEIGSVTVRMNTFPVVRLALGHVDTLTIDVVEPQWGGLTWSGLTVHGEGLKFNTRALWSGALELDSAQRLDAQLTVSETDLERYLYASVAEVDQVDVTLISGKVLMEGEASVLGRRVRFQSQGKVMLRDSNAGLVLQYVPEELSVADERVPDLLLALLAPLLQQTVEMSSLPMGLTLGRISIHDGFAVLHGTMLP